MSRKSKQTEVNKSEHMLWHVQTGNYNYIVPK